MIGLSVGFEPFQIYMLGIASVFGTIVVIELLAKIAPLLNLTDIPDERKRHGSPTAQVGGLGIFLVLILATLATETPNVLSGILFSSVILVFVGAIDDAIGLGVKIRFLTQLIAVAIVIGTSGLLIKELGLFSSGSSIIPEWLGIAITAFSVIGLINGFNMVDGIDGLAAGHALVALLLLGSTLWFANGFILHFQWLVLLGASIIGFLSSNLGIFKFKKVFLGDAGSMLLGFLLAWLLVMYSQEPVLAIEPLAALWCVALPVFDTLVVIIRRLNSGRSPFSPDRLHLHHLLGDLGWSHRRVLITLLSISLALGCVGIFATYWISREWVIAMYVAMFLVFKYSTSRLARAEICPRVNSKFFKWK